LLDTFNHLNLLPSSSYIYKALKNKIVINFDITDDLAFTIGQNIRQFFSNRKGFFTIKMDEVAIVPKIRYHRKNNCFVGTCSNHMLNKDSYKFNNFADLDFLHDSLISKETHLAHEALVITISSLSSSDNYPRPILISPICNHSNETLLIESIKEIATQFKELNSDAFLVNVATDGDPSRRKTLNSMRRPQRHLKALHGLPFFDQNLLLGYLGINFDAKHIIKRLRSLIVSFKRETKLVQVRINRFVLEELFKDFPEGLILMDVKDKQNVPSAVKLFKLIKEKTEGPPDANLSKLKKDLYHELQLFGLIGCLLCSIFYETKTSLVDQLVKLSHLSHILLFVFRRNNVNFLTTNLYADIQSTIQDAFVSAAIMQEHSPNTKLFLFMLGSDQLENLFATVRTITHASNCDLLELSERITMALQIEKVITINIIIVFKRLITLNNYL
jgi:hypothetical protein